MKFNQKYSRVTKEYKSGEDYLQDRGIFDNDGYLVADVESKNNKLVITYVRVE